MTRAMVAPELLRWARERAGLAPDELCKNFAKLPEWERGERQPTLKQLNAFAKAVHVPVGYLFLPEPPEEHLPIPDFRTLPGRRVSRPSPNLLNMIYICQERQDWYRDFAQSSQQPPLDFIGRANTTMPPHKVAEQMRKSLDFDSADQQKCSSWEAAMRLFIRRAEDAGILVMVSGVVLSNNNRPLDPKEFRGFALSDPLAPLVFINGSDAKAAQMFTLAHEIAHLWLNASALSNLAATSVSSSRNEEAWCNAVAAEFLVPLAMLKDKLATNEPLEDALSRLTQIFKVSNLVILRRLLDAQYLDRAAFDEAWEQQMVAVRARAQKLKGGGNFYRTTLSRASSRFTSALVVSTLEGQTLYRDAFRMLGISNVETLNKLHLEIEARE